jgi:hypothetical protein
MNGQTVREIYILLLEVELGLLNPRQQAARLQWTQVAGHLHRLPRQKRLKLNSLFGEQQTQRQERLYTTEMVQCFLAQLWVQLVRPGVCVILQRTAQLGQVLAHVISFQITL